MRPRALLVLLVLMTAGTLVGGCATASKDEVSSIPWNRPQSWEGSSGFGGFRTPGSN